MRTAESLNPNTLNSQESITINGIEYKRNRNLETSRAVNKSTTTYTTVFQSTIGHEVERASGNAVEFPFVTIAVDVKTTNSKKKGKVQTAELNKRQTKIGVV